MPERTYMGVDVRRDHSLRVPDPLASLSHGVPNACTQCHKDRKDQWAADFLAKRTGRKQPWYAHTSLLAAARRNDAAVLPELLAYAEDTGRPAILRGTALLESGRFVAPGQLATIDVALRATDPQLRVGAVSALGNLDLAERLRHLQPLLGDPVKAVRMAVAQQLAQVPLNQAPAQVQPSLGRLFEEYRQSLLYNADMPESQSNLSLHQAAQGDLAAAERSLRHALKLAPRYLPAMLNLSDIYRATGRDDAGEILLRDAMAAYPESADARHMLGLLYVRARRTTESVPLFAAASRLAPDNAQYALVLALALNETGRRPEAVRVLEAAARRFPGNAQIQQLLASYK
jgi:tetratricopeptide (TPR) repeat protein